MPSEVFLWIFVVVAVTLSIAAIVESLLHRQNQMIGCAAMPGDESATTVINPANFPYTQFVSDFKPYIVFSVDGFTLTTAGTYRLTAVLETQKIAGVPEFFDDLNNIHLGLLMNSPDSPIIVTTMDQTVVVSIVPAHVVVRPGPDTGFSVTLGVSPPSPVIMGTFMVAFVHT
jgi:hypothetical protein